MLGGYLAHFMWKRLCVINGMDPFLQILADIAKHYNANEWRTWAEASIFTSCSTEKKQRLARRKGVNLVSWLMIALMLFAVE